MAEERNVNPEERKPSVNRTRQRIVLWAGMLALVAGGGLAVKYGRHHVFPKRFAMVEPGLVYRSGELEAGPLRGVIREHKLKTLVVLLGNEPDSSRQQQEERIAREEGAQIIRVGMPGDGCAEFDLLERAADEVATESNQPLLVHCSAGVNRTGAVLAVWRMKYCGWTFEQAIAEAELHGMSTGQRLVDHLRRLHDERLQPSDQ